MYNKNSKIKEQDQIDVAVCPPAKRLFYNCPLGRAIKGMGQMKRNKNAFPCQPTVLSILSAHTWM